MTCFFCKGNMIKGKNTYFADTNSGIVIIKEVPCNKCTQCGEVAYNGVIVQKLENILDSLESPFYRDITVMNFEEFKVNFDNVAVFAP